MYFTGNDLKALRGGLSLNEESFAKHLGLNTKVYRKAEKFRDKTIPIDGEFNLLFNKLCYAAPKMIIIRFEHMQKIQQVLQLVAQKLEKVDKWLRSEERRKQEKKSDGPDDKVEEDGGDKKHILLRNGGLDKRSAFTTDEND